MLRDPTLICLPESDSCRMVVASSAAVLGYTAQDREFGGIQLAKPKLSQCAAVWIGVPLKILRGSLFEKNCREAAIVIMLLFMAWLVKVPVQRISITVDGSEIRRENQLRLVVYAIIYKVSRIPGWLFGISWTINRRSWSTCWFFTHFLPHAAQGVQPRRDQERYIQMTEVAGVWRVMKAERFWCKTDRIPLRGVAESLFKSLFYSDSFSRFLYVAIYEFQNSSVCQNRSRVTILL